MPWLAANGLLPGRGIPVGAAAGAAGGVAAAGAAGAAASGAFGAEGAAGAGAAGASATGAGAALGAAGAFFGSSFGLAFGYASRSFFATGGATVDDPPLTNSPNSLSFAKASLVSIPSSLAKSYTRGKAATFSPVWANPGRAGH